MVEYRPLDPKLRDYLEERERTAPLQPASLSDQERLLAVRASMMSGLKDRGTIKGLPNEVWSEDLQLRAAKARLYSPKDRFGLPLVLHLHGGGWVCGNVETHDPFCRILAFRAQVSVLSVDYRLSPEHPHPAALEDAHDAFDTALKHGRSWGIDPARIIVSGDSAGGNLAAVLVNHLCTGGAPSALVGQALLCPVVDHPNAGHASYRETSHTFGREFMEWLFDKYAPAASPIEPDIAPLVSSDLSRLPPTFVATAGHDILRDEALAYVEKLRSFEVDVFHHHAPDMHHNYFVNPATVMRFPQCEQALDALSNWIVDLAGKKEQLRP